MMRGAQVLFVLVNLESGGGKDFRRLLYSVCRNGGFRESVYMRSKV